MVGLVPDSQPLDGNQSVHEIETAPIAGLGAEPPTRVLMAPAGDGAADRTAIRDGPSTLPSGAGEGPFVHLPTTTETPMTRFEKPEPEQDASFTTGIPQVPNRPHGGGGEGDAWGHTRYADIPNPHRDTPEYRAAYEAEARRYDDGGYIPAPQPMTNPGPYREHIYGNPPYAPPNWSPFAPQGPQANAAVVNNIRIGGARPFNHTWHLILTICTCGLWAPVWLIAYLLHPKG